MVAAFRNLSLCGMSVKAPPMCTQQVYLVYSSAISFLQFEISPIVRTSKTVADRVCEFFPKEDSQFALEIDQ
jgi:hypothetical protein